MRKFFSMTAFVLSIMMVFTVFSGCQKKTKYDPTKTQLFVASYNGGYGVEWLDKAIKRFEAEYADYSFEEGKTGIEVWPDADKDSFTAKSLLTTMSRSAYEVFFTEGGRYREFVEDGLIYEITDIVKDTNLPGEEVTIESKLSDAQKAIYSIENKYYAIPNYNALRGISYDIDLFNAQKYYFAKNGAPSEQGFSGSYRWTNLAGERSAGPDGKYGTYDDGLPATYEEFFELCEQIKTKDRSAILWTGEYRQIYTSFLLDALFYDYEGVENGLASMTMPIGKEIEIAKVVNGVMQFGQDGKPLTENFTLTTENYPMLQRQLGKYYALQFLERLVGYASESSFTDTRSHVMAQSDYLNSKYEGKAVGMIIDGSWWINEADVSGVFKSMSSYPGASRAERRFGMMPMPKVSSEHIGSKNTVYDGNESMAFINATIPANKIEAAKKFLQFITTDVSLREFNVTTGVTKAYKYDISDDYDKLNEYAKSLYNIVKTSDIAYSGNINIEGVTVSALNKYNTFYSSKVGTSTYVPCNAIKFSNISAKELFVGLYSYLA